MLQKAAAGEDMLCSPTIKYDIITFRQFVGDRQVKIMHKCWRFIGTEIHRMNIFLQQSEIPEQSF